MKSEDISRRSFLKRAAALSAAAAIPSFWIPSKANAMPGVDVYKRQPLDTGERHRRPLYLAAYPFRRRTAGYRVAGRMGN